MKIELLRQGNKIASITDEKYYDFDSPLLYKWVNTYHFNALNNPSVTDFSVSNQAKTNKEKDNITFLWTVGFCIINFPLFFHGEDGIPYYGLKTV